MHFYAFQMHTQIGLKSFIYKLFQNKIFLSFLILLITIFQKNQHQNIQTFFFHFLLLLKKIIIKQNFFTFWSYHF